MLSVNPVEIRTAQIKNEVWEVASSTFPFNWKELSILDPIFLEGYLYRPCWFVVKASNSSIYVRPYHKGHTVLHKGTDAKDCYQWLERFGDDIWKSKMYW